jgi:hypothetical protein
MFLDDGIRPAREAGWRVPTKNPPKSRWCRPFFINFASPNRKFYHIVGLGVPVGRR